MVLCAVLWTERHDRQTYVPKCLTSTIASGPETLAAAAVAVDDCDCGGCGGCECGCRGDPTSGWTSVDVGIT